MVRVAEPVVRPCGSYTHADWKWDVSRLGRVYRRYMTNYYRVEVYGFKARASNAIVSHEVLATGRALRLARAKRNKPKETP